MIAMRPMDDRKNRVKAESVGMRRLIPRFCADFATSLNFRMKCPEHA
jgi:hypothetical protein